MDAAAIETKHKTQVTGDLLPPHEEAAYCGVSHHVFHLPNFLMCKYSKKSIILLIYLIT